MSQSVASGARFQNTLADMRQARKRTLLTEQEKTILRLGSEKPKTQTQTALNKLRVGYHLNGIEEVLKMIAGI